MRPLTVFIAPVKLPSAPVVTPRLPAPPAPPPPMRELARAEVPKPLPVAPIVAKPVEPPPQPLVPAAAPAVERPIEKPEVQRPPEIGLFERTNGARTSQAAAAVTTGGFGSAAASPRDAANGRRRHDRWIQQRGARAAWGRKRVRRGADGGVRSTGECARPAFRGSGDEAHRSAGRDRLQAHAGVHRRSAQRPHRRHRVARARIHRRRRRPRAARRARTRPRPRRSGPAGGTPHSFQARAVGRPGPSIPAPRFTSRSACPSQRHLCDLHVFPCCSLRCSRPPLRRRSPMQQAKDKKVQRPRRQAAQDRSKPTTSSTG